MNLWFAAVLAEEVRRHDVRYLHAHFADNAAELTYFASRRSGSSVYLPPSGKYSTEPKRWTPKTCW